MVTGKAPSTSRKGAQLGDNEVNFDSLTPGTTLKRTFTNKRKKKIDPSTKGM